MNFQQRLILLKKAFFIHSRFQREWLFIYVGGRGHKLVLQSVNFNYFLTAFT